MKATFLFHFRDIGKFDDQVEDIIRAKSSLGLFKLASSTEGSTELKKGKPVIRNQ